MINFSACEFITSSKGKLDSKFTPLDEVLFIGRSNVGKSSLVNSLTNNAKLAYVSSKPGHTKLLNYFLIDKSFYLVDAPGYGYAAGDKKFYLEYEKIMDAYFLDNKALKLVVLLVDIRRGIKEYELDLIEYFKELNINFCITFTKVDKAKQQDLAKIKKEYKELNIDSSIVFYSRFDKKTSLDELKKYLSNYLKK